MSTPIAKDATSKVVDASAGTTATLSHTCSGSNRLLAAFVVSQKNGTQAAPTGVTYNGVAMSKVAGTEQQASVGATQHQGAWWILIAPDTGTHDIVATWASSRDKKAIIAVSFTGAKQSAQPEAVNSGAGYFGDSGSGSTLSITSTSSNAKLLSAITGDGSLGQVTAPMISYNSDSGTSGFVLGVGAVRKISAGAQTLTWSNTRFTSGIESNIAITALDTTGAGPYYIDSIAGDDENIGTEALPMATASAVSSTNALSAGDIVYVKKGSTFEGYNATFFGRIDSTASATNPIVFKTYGSGANPKLCGNSVYGGSWTNSSGSIYYASSITWTCRTVTVDDSSALWRSDSLAHMIAGTFYFDDAADRVYVWLADSSDPSGHSIRLSRYPESENGLLNPQPDSNGGGWVRNRTGFSFLEFDVIGSNWYGTLHTGSYVTYTICRFIGGCYDGIIASTYGNWDGSRLTVDKCEVAYNVTNGTGNGQGITLNAPYGRVENCQIHHNGMAGIDVLNYSSTNTDASYAVLKHNHVYRNAQWPGASFSSSNYDPGIYVDGGQNVLIYGNIVHDNGRGNGTAISAGITVYPENPTQRLPYNVYVLNNAIYATVGEVGISMSVPDTYTLEGCWVMGNSIVRGETALYSMYFENIGVDGLKMYYNNFAYGSPPILCYTTTSLDRLISDYNFIYNGGSSAYATISGGITQRTLAYVQSNYGIETNSSASDALMVDINSDATTDVHLQAGSPAIDFSDGSQWANLPDWVKAEIGPAQPRGSVLASNVRDTGSADNGFHFNSGMSQMNGVTVTGITLT